MRRIIYDVAVSLDGYIAGPDDDVSAYPAQGDHVAAYMARLQTYDTVIMGRRTYEFGYAYGMKPGARPYPHMDHVIFSRSLKLPADAEVRVVRDDFEGEVARLKAVDGGDIYLCGGGAFAGLLANAGLIDLVRLKIAPAVVGAGVRLFEGLAAPLAMARASAEICASGVVFVEYRVNPR